MFIAYRLYYRFIRQFIRFIRHCILRIRCTIRLTGILSGIFDVVLCLSVVLLIYSAVSSVYLSNRHSSWFFRFRQSPICRIISSSSIFFGLFGFVYCLFVVPSVYPAFDSVYPAMYIAYSSFHPVYAWLFLADPSIWSIRSCMHLSVVLSVDPPFYWAIRHCIWLICFTICLFGILSSVSGDVYRVLSFHPFIGHFLRLIRRCIMLIRRCILFIQHFIRSIFWCLSLIRRTICFSDILSSLSGVVYRLCVVLSVYPAFYAV